MKLLNSRYIKSTLLSFGATLIIGGTAYASYSFVDKDTVTIHPSYAFDPNQKEQLVGFSSNVFIGTIVKKEKEIQDKPMPVSVYTVSVDENIKGELMGEVKVLQRIGYDEKGKAEVKYEGDNYLTEGEQYLFTTNVNNKFGGYIISMPVYGNTILNEKNKVKTVNGFKEAKKVEKDPMEEMAKAKEEKEHQNKGN